MSSTPDIIAYCHSCGNPIDVTAVAPFSNVECPHCRKHTRVKQEFGSYTLVRRHAVGGMSVVFIAHDNTLDREVALKILNEDYSSDENRIRAFAEEARLTASFTHPNVVRVLTTGRAFGRFYIAMELVPGGHFEQQIHERGAIPEEELVPLAIQVAHGLQAAHAAGLIHRDVKPGNILIDAEGNAKLVDFGLALVTKGGRAKATEIWATPYYVPPETFEGKEEDFRSDIYAFGATLYHALAGKPSCDEQTMATAALRRAKRNIPSLHQIAPQVSASLCEIVDKAMAYEPSRRFASYEELISRLEAVGRRQQSDTVAFSASAEFRASRQRRDRWVMAGIGATLLLAIGAFYGVSRRAVEAIPAISENVTRLVVPEEPPRSRPATGTTPVEIARRYREAKTATEKGEYTTSSELLLALHGDPSVQEPTRSWAGVEAMANDYLDDRLREARLNAQAVASHFRELPADNPFRVRMLPSLEHLTGEAKGPETPPERTKIDGIEMMSWLLAGWDLWSGGKFDEAAVWFRAVQTTSVAQEDVWLDFYRRFATAYLADLALLDNEVFATAPANLAEYDQSIAAVTALLPQFQTRGAAPRLAIDWKNDLIGGRAQFLKAAETAPELPAADTPPMASETAPLDDMARFDELAQSYDFKGAIRFYDEVEFAPPERESLIRMAKAADHFLTDLLTDLQKASAAADMPLRDGSSATKIAADATGKLTISDGEGALKEVEWKDFAPEALVNLHRVLIRDVRSSAARSHRHLSAVAFDWLVGQRERAVLAAERLSRESTAFRTEWEKLSEGLAD